MYSYDAYNIWLAGQSIFQHKTICHRHLLGDIMTTRNWSLWNKIYFISRSLFRSRSVHACYLPVNVLYIYHPVLLKTATYRFSSTQSVVGCYLPFCRHRHRPLFPYHLHPSHHTLELNDGGGVGGGPAKQSIHAARLSASARCPENGSQCWRIFFLLLLFLTVFGFKTRDLRLTCALICGHSPRQPPKCVYISLIGFI